MVTETEQSLRIAALETEILHLRAELASLQRLLGLDSATSSKPPSSDGFKKRTASLRGSSGLSSGGQLGHKGFTLKCVETPNHIEPHRPEVCVACELPISAETPVEGQEKRQVFELSVPKIEVTEHRSLRVRCTCGHLNKGVFPPNVRARAQYGETIRAAASYLSIEQLLPIKRVAQTLQDVHGLSACGATMSNFLAKKAEELAPKSLEIAAKLHNAPLKHLDETGLRVKGKLNWLHVMSSTSLTHYRLDEKRGAIAKISSGIAVHDHWKPYFKLEGVEHALCNAHHVRELNALIEHEKEDWAKEMRDFLLSTLNLVENAKKKGESCLMPSQIQTLELQYEAIIKQGLDFQVGKMVIPPDLKRGTIKRAIGHNLLNRLNDRRQDVLRFTHNFTVPFTNNQAERDIRMMKVKQKISGCFRTSLGANTFLTLKSVLSTAKKQGIKAINILANTQTLNVAVNHA